ncbi:MAG: nodulation protein NfeD [Gemmatales bacterium]|nr:MAG: nodulation protein NfeD [Gemmatales bacterium]
MNRFVFTGISHRHPSSTHDGFFIRWPACLSLIVTFLFTLPAWGEDRVDGLFITVQDPITSDVVKRIDTRIKRFLDQASGENVKIVFDFNPDRQPSSTPDYGPCRSLAQLILGLQDVTTIAYVHNEVTGHSVLPVLACHDLVMSKGGKPIKERLLSAEGKLGDILRGQDRPLQEDQQIYYMYVARRRGHAPAVVLKMADAGVELIKGTRAGGVTYIDGRQLDQERKKGFVPVGENPVMPAGRRAVYSAQQAFDFGLCQVFAETRQQLAEVYQLPAHAQREDPLEGRSPVACLVEVRGQVDGRLKETLTRRMRRAIGTQGVNLFVLQLECGGGDTQVARELADFFRNLKDNHGEYRVMTLAYVTERARDTATFLALGCSEIVMHENAHLGGFEDIVRERPDYREAILASLKGLAIDQQYPPLLAEGMLDPDIAIHRVRSRTGPLQRRLITGRELLLDQNNERIWIDEGQIKARGTWFRIDAQLARELGLIRCIVRGQARQALKQVYAEYGLTNVKEARLDWLDELAAFLRLGWVGVLLVMIGITGLILELKLPGFGVPGVTAAIAFVLYFWAHSQLAGQWTMLAILLFLLGLILVAVEIFLIPGFGFTGISGIFLVIISLALVTLVKKPETTSEWIGFSSTLGQFALAILLAIAIAFPIASYLANWLVLKPPDAAAEGEAEVPTSATAYEIDPSLLGAIGEAATTLRPAGKARFGDDFIDVIAEGSYVQPGARVQIIEIEGNRIVVKQV